MGSGMAWTDDGLIIADRLEKRLVIVRPSGKFETLHKMSEPFGVAIDAQGRVLATEKKVQKTDPIENNHIVRFDGGKREELVDHTKAGNPHFITVHKNGTMYWSGFPDGGTRSRKPDGTITVHEPRIGHTYGVALSPKQDWFFISSKLPDKDNRAVWRFPVSPDGTLGRGEKFMVMKDLRPKLEGLPAPKDGDETLTGWIGRVQGLTIDKHGNFYVAGSEAHSSGAAVAVISPDGKEVLAMILDVPTNISSLCLTPDQRRLYITGAGQYRLHVVDFEAKDRLSK